MNKTFYELHKEEILNREVQLKDPKGNVSRLMVREMQQNLVTIGYLEETGKLVDLYGLRGLKWLRMEYRGACMFDITIVNEKLEEIQYPDPVPQPDADVAVPEQVLPVANPIIEQPVENPQPQPQQILLWDRDVTTEFARGKNPLVSVSKFYCS